MNQLSQIQRGGQSLTSHGHRSHHARHPELKNPRLRSISDLVTFFVGSEVVEYCYELFAGFRYFSGLIRNQDVLCS
jgi:hypothetical protein